MSKDEIRTALKSKRRALTAEEQAEKSSRITDFFLSLSLYNKADTVMIYMSSFNEPSTAAIIDALKRDSKRVVVPISNTADFTITPAYLSDAIKTGAYGIPEPEECIKADVADIDIALIPGIAFDKSGSRIGFGKGYYDRFLLEFKGIKAGICYDFQVLDEIPSSEHDIKMDMIITEKRIYNDF